MKAHLAGVEARRSRLLQTQIDRQADVQVQDTSETDRDVESLGARLLTQTLLDDGPDVVHQPSRLWTLRAAFQRSQRPILHSDNLVVPPISDVVDAVSRLSFSNQNLVPNLDAAHPDRPPPITSIADPPSCSGPPPYNASRLTRQNMSKRERNRYTTWALDTLYSIEALLPPCHEKLSTILSAEVLREVDSVASRLRAGLEAVKHCTPEVDRCKMEISGDLEKIETRVHELKLLPAGLKKDALHYASGEYLILHIHMMLTK